METIRIEAVAGCAKREWHEEYRRLRHRVFVVEQGWTGLASDEEPGATVPDPADERARFWLARSATGTLVGAVRVRGVADVFPHEDLFGHHLERPDVAAMRPFMGTLNSLLVDREWRGRRCRGPDGQVGTAANLLLRASLAGSAAAGLRSLVATAQTRVSVRALMRAGFVVIDPPALTHLHPAFPMCNVGVVIGPRDHSGRALAAYFDDRQREALGGSTVDALFEIALMAAAWALTDPRPSGATPLHRGGPT
jgi:N-acyl-L-homoserine lactone synthetase